MQEYRTVAQEASDEFVEKRSRFIGTVRPVQTEEEATAFIKEMRERYWDASHNVYAYILREGQLKRYTDDGEPQGTAGVPVLDVLQKEGLTNLAVVVTRYFGGTLLGAGGLVRAYSHGAKLAVDAAGVQVMRPCTILELDVEYPMYGTVNHLLPKHRAVVQSSDFGVAVKLRLLLTDAALPAFVRELTEVTGATVHPYEVEHLYADLP